MVSGGPVYLTWNLSLLDVCGASFIYLGTFSPVISSNILVLLALSLPLLRLPQCVCYSSWCFTGHLGSIKNFFFQSVISIGLSFKFPDSCMCPNAALNPSGEFLILATVLFNSIIQHFKTSS